MQIKNNQEQASVGSNLIDQGDNTEESVHDITLQKPSYEKRKLAAELILETRKILMFL